LIPFIQNIALFITLALLLLLGIPLLTSHYVKSKDFNNGNTESNLLILDDRKDFDYLFLGNSHARNFSRYNQHGNLEKQLEGSVLNFGQGKGLCGINDQYFYLKYLLSQGYNFKHIVHCVSSPYLFDNRLNSGTTTFYAEPLSIKVLANYLKHPAPNKITRLAHYIKTKWTPRWIKLHPDQTSSKDKKLSQLNPKSVEDGFKLAFPNGILENAVESNSSILEQCISLAKSHGIKTSLIQTPTLFESWPGQKRFNNYCENMASDSLSEYCWCQTLVAYT